MMDPLAAFILGSIFTNMIAIPTVMIANRIQQAEVRYLLENKEPRVDHPLSIEDDRADLIDEE